MNFKVETYDLVRRLYYALDIAGQSLQLGGSTGFTNPDIPEATVRPEKVIAETGLLLYVSSLLISNPTLRDLDTNPTFRDPDTNPARRYQDPNPALRDQDTNPTLRDLDTATELRQRIDAVARLLIPQARCERVLLEVCLQPAVAVDYAEAHIFLTCIGFPDPKFEALLATMIGSPEHHSKERFPHRVLEQEWVKKLWNRTPQNTPDLSKTIACTPLGYSLDLLLGSRDDLYAFTHAIMYVTGFNDRPWSLPRSRCDILLEAEGMLARSLDEEDYDLAAEILLSWPLTGEGWSATATFAFRVLRNVEDKVGFLPTSSTRIATLEKLGGIERKKYFLATSYHTIYVMGLLCAVSLQPGKLPPEQLPQEQTSPGAPAAILPYLMQTGPRPHWLEEFARLSPAEKDQLTGLLLDVALYRSARKKDYESVFQLLRLAYDLGIANTAMAAQAARLLERLSSFASTNHAVSQQ